MSDLVKRLRNWTTDWDGSKMVPGEPPKDGLHCDIIDEAAARIEALEAALTIDPWLLGYTGWKMHVDEALTTFRDRRATGEGDQNG